MTFDTKSRTGEPLHEALMGSNTLKKILKGDGMEAERKKMYKVWGKSVPRQWESHEGGYSLKVHDGFLFFTHSPGGTHILEHLPPAKNIDKYLVNQIPAKDILMYSFEDGSSQAFGDNHRFINYLGAMEKATGLPIKIKREMITGMLTLNMDGYEHKKDVTKIILLDYKKCLIQENEKRLAKIKDLTSKLYD